MFEGGSLVRLQNSRGHLGLTLCEAEVLLTHAKLPTQTGASTRSCHASVETSPQKQG